MSILERVKLPSTGENIILRKAKHEDVAIIENEFDLPEMFDCGIWNRQLFFKTSSEQWLIIENSKAEIISFQMGNRMSNGITMAWQIAVCGKYRGLGVTRIFDKFSEGRAIAGSTEMSIARYSFEKFGFKILTFSGPCPASYVSQKLLPDIIIRKAFESDAADVISYDKSLCKVERSEFVRGYSFSEKHQFTFIARNKDSVISGYATAREYPENYWVLAPIYADSTTIAENLVSRLVKVLQSKMLVLYFPDFHKASLQISKDLGLVWSSTEVRNFFSNDEAADYHDKLDFNRAYSIHEYFPI